MYFLIDEALWLVFRSLSIVAKVLAFSGVWMIGVARRLQRYRYRRITRRIIKRHRPFLTSWQLDAAVSSKEDQLDAWLEDLKNQAKS